MIFMKDIQDAILDMGGRQSGEGTGLLCMAIEEARRYQPVMPQMKVIWNSLNRRVGKGSAKSISKAWSGRSGACGCTATGRSWPPTAAAGSTTAPAKEFISVVAARLWDGVERTPEQVG